MRLNRFLLVFVGILMALGLGGIDFGTVLGQTSPRNSSIGNKLSSPTINLTVDKLPDRPVVKTRPLVTIAAPTDEIQIDYTKIYVIHVLPNFLALVELPDEPETLIVGNPARFQVDKYPGTNPDPSGSKAPKNAATRTILVKPLKVGTDDGPIESNLTIPLANGKIISMLLRNAENENQTVYRCVFRDSDQARINQELKDNRKLEAQRKTERRQSLENSIERAKQSVRQLAGQSLSLVPAGEIRLKEANTSLYLKREDEFLLAVLRVSPQKSAKTLTLTTPTWKIDGVDLLPQAEAEPLPTVTKKKDVWGSFIFQVPAWGHDSPEPGLTDPQNISVGLAVSGQVIQLNGALESIGPNLNRSRAKVKAFPGLTPSNPTQNPSFSPASPKPGSTGADSLSPEQLQGLELLGEITGVKPPESKAPSTSTSTTTPPRQPCGNAQERLNFLTQVSNVRSRGMILSQTKQASVGLFIEPCSESLLAVVSLERKLGSEPLELSQIQWTINGLSATPGLVIKPFPPYLTTQPLVAGFLFQGLSNPGSTCTLNLKIGWDPHRLAWPSAPPNPSERPAGSSVSTAIGSVLKRVQTNSIEWFLVEFAVTNQETRFVWEVRNQGTGPINQFEAFISQTTRHADGSETIRSFPARGVADKKRLNAGDRTRITFVFAGTPPKEPVELRWRCGGVVYGTKVEVWK